MALFKKKAVIDSFMTLILELTPNLITIAIFGTYIYTGHNVDAKAAFTLVSTLMVLQNPIKQLPGAISAVLDLKVSLDRVSKFLLAEDIQADYIKKSEDLDVAIKMTNGNFYWLTEEERKLKKKKEDEEKQKAESAEDSGGAEKAEGDKKDEKKDDGSGSEEKKEAEVEKQASESLNENGGERLILKDINLEIKKGSFVAILGE